MKAKLSPVERVIDALGGPTKAAEAMKLSGANVIMNWRSRGQVPADKVILAETLSGVSRHELRPDIFGKGGAAA